METKKKIDEWLFVICRIASLCSFNKEKDE